MQTEAEIAVERLRRQQKALADFGLHAFRSRDLDELLHRAAELVAEGLDVRRTKVLELLPGGDKVIVRAGVGWKPGVVGNVQLGADRDSPAGYALRHEEPVVSPDLDRETRFRIPQVLIDHGIKSMVNVLIAGEDGPFGVLEVDAARPRNFDEDDIAFLRNCANLLAAAVGRHRVHRALEQAASERKVLIDELAHRSRNMFGLVKSLAAQTTAEEAAAKAFRDAFVGRLQALVRAENLVFEYEGREVDLAQLAEQSLEPFEGDRRRAVTIDGGPLRLPARYGRILALILHELATNAVKHGALSVPEGHVRLSWTLTRAGGRNQVHFDWNETDGPAMRQSHHQGFGTKLLRRLAAAELGGRARLDHTNSGLRYELVFPVAEEDEITLTALTRADRAPE